MSGPSIDHCSDKSKSLAGNAAKRHKQESAETVGQYLIKTTSLKGTQHGLSVTGVILIIIKEQQEQEEDEEEEVISVFIRVVLFVLLFNEISKAAVLIERPVTITTTLPVFLTTVDLWVATPV